MMMRVAAKVAKILSPVVVRANNKNLTRRVAPYTSLVGESSVSTATATASSSSFDKNPCLDLYHELAIAKAPKSCKRYLNPILLTLAWSHDPLTTLKLICNLGITRYGTTVYRGGESFHTALLWLHQNHPKTLACNVEAIVGREYSDVSIGCLEDFVLILYQLLLPEGASRGDILYSSAIDVSIHKKGVLERYERDPNYQFLHDRVSDVFAANFRSDFEKLKKKKPNEKMYRDEFSKASAPNVLGPLARYGHRNTEYGASVAVATTFLCESIARKVFPCELDVEKDEAHYTHIVLNRLSKEVLEPVWSILEPEWSMEYYSRFSVCKVRRYLEDVKAGKSKIAADALLPHEIISYVNDPHADNIHDVKYNSDSDDSYEVDRPDVGDVAKLQWKAMVDDLSNKGNWKNCFAVCQFFRDPSDVSKAGLSEVMGLLVSQLNDKEPWKGKVIPFTRNPKRLHLIQGDDLKSKLACFRGKDFSGNSATTQKALDLILQEAVNANLKPEQMIKRVLVLAFTDVNNMSSIQAEHWPITYQIMRSKFEEKGYAVPHIVFWYMYSSDSDSDMVVSSQLSGMTTFSGYSDNFFKLFLDREGDVGPNHAMEAAICGKEYQNLVVVD